MDFSAIFQTRTKKFWWMDVIFYFVISLLVATLFCYAIFWLKNSFQRVSIQKEAAELLTVGTPDQRQHEQSVITYQSKISDFTNLLKNHEFASNVFAFMEAQTLPNIWFNQFSLDEKNSAVQLSGESDDMQSFSRQVAIFERNQYVKKVGTLNSSLGDSAKVEFNIGLTLDQSIFSYIASGPSITQTTSSAEPLTTDTGVTSTGEAATITDSTAGTQQASVTSAGQKLITSFDFISLHPLVIGQVDETNYAISLNVPYGTDVKDLTPSIVTSPGVSVSPNSGIPQDFTTPLTYRITGQDGSMQNYTVKVAVSQAATQGGSGKTSGKSKAIILLIAVVVIAIVAGIIIFIFISRRNNKSKTSLE